MKKFFDRLFKIPRDDNSLLLKHLTVLEDKIVYLEGRVLLLENKQKRKRQSTVDLGVAEDFYVYPNNSNQGTKEKI